MIGPTRRSKKGGWTEEEDKTLANAVQKYNGKNWKKIAECIPDRTDVQCLHRWQKVLNPELVKGPWTKEEDDQIIEMVEKWGNKKWSEISKYLPGRIGKQCRERWHNHLNPNIKKTAWTKEEELILIKAHNIYGNKWAEIAKILHGRTENSIKNHWNCSIRKKLEYSSQTGGGSRNPEEVKQTLDRRVNAERSFNLCSLDLGHGAPMSRESRLQSSVEDVFEKRGDIMTKSSSTNISHGRDVDSCLPNSSRCQRTAEDIAILGGSHDMIANLPNKLCSSSLSDVSKIPVFYGIQTHKPGDGIDLLPSRSLSGPLQACLSTPVAVYGKPALAVTTDKRLFKPSSDQQGNTSSAIDFGQSNSKLIGQPDNSVSTTMKYEGRNHAGACENLGNRNHAGFLCYKPLQQEDMNIFLETGKFPSTDSYIQAASSSISCCTDSSTDSILTSLSSQSENTPSLSSQFENTPSIIRKRRVFDRQSGNANHRKDIYSHKERLNNDPQFRRPHPYSEYAVSSKLQLKSQKHGTSSAIKSVEKRLEHVFDVEWNTTRAISRTSNADSI